MARRTDRRLKKPKRVRVLKRFMEDEWDDEREDVIGQPNDKSDVAAER